MDGGHKAVYPITSSHLGFQKPEERTGVEGRAAGGGGWAPRRPSAQASDSVSVEGRTTPSVDIAEVRGCLPVSLKDAPVHPTSGSLGEMPEETGLTLGSWEGIGQDRTLWRVVLPCVPLPCSCA